MDLLKSFSVEMEMDKHGSLFSTNDNKSLRISNSTDYPATHGMVKEYKKALGRELLQVLKKDNMYHMHTMITVHGFDKFYETHNFHRFTFDRYDGKVWVETRPYDSTKGFDVIDTIPFDNDKQARDFMVEEIVKYIYTYIDVKENSENYFTQNM